MQDFEQPDLLFIGTENGIYTSLNGGGEWKKLDGAPTIPFRDLVIQERENDLVGASFGRSFWVLDDYSPAMRGGTIPATTTPEWARMCMLRKICARRSLPDRAKEAPQAFSKVPPINVEVSMKILSGLILLTFLLGCESGETPDYRASEAAAPEAANTAKGPGERVLYSENRYAAALGDSTVRVAIDRSFIQDTDGGMRAILAYYSTLAGTDCNWNGGKADAKQANLNCQLTSALDLGTQCSTSHKNFIRKWFAGQQAVLEHIDDCYHTPFADASHTSFDYLNVKRTGEDVTVRYRLVSDNGRYQEQVNHFRVYTDHVEMLD